MSLTPTSNGKSNRELLDEESGIRGEPSTPRQPHASDEEDWKPLEYYGSKNSKQVSPSIGESSNREERLKVRNARKKGHEQLEEKDATGNPKGAQEAIGNGEDQNEQKKVPEAREEQKKGSIDVNVSVKRSLNNVFSREPPKSQSLDEDIMEVKEERTQEQMSSPIRKRFLSQPPRVSVKVLLEKADSSARVSAPPAPRSEPQSEIRPPSPPPQTAPLRSQKSPIAKQKSQPSRGEINFGQSLRDGAQSEETLDEGCADSIPKSRVRSVARPRSVEIRSSLTNRLLYGMENDAGVPKDFLNQLRRTDEEVIEEGRVELGSYQVRTSSEKRSHIISDSGEDEVQFVGIQKKIAGGSSGNDVSRKGVALPNRRRTRNSLRVIDNISRSSRELSTGAFYDGLAPARDKQKRQKVRDSRLSNESIPLRERRIRLRQVADDSISKSVLSDPVEEVARARMEKTQSETSSQSEPEVRLHENINADVKQIHQCLSSFIVDKMGIVVLHHQGITMELLNTLCASFDDKLVIAKLNLSSNKIAGLPIDIRKTCQRTSLIVLDLSSNRIEQLPYWFYDDCVHLHHLNLSHNELFEVDGRIAQFKELELLNLSHNNLKKLPEGLGRLHRLRSLDVHANQLEKLPDDFGAENHKLVCFDFSDNPNFRHGLPVHFNEEFEDLEDIFYTGTMLYTACKKKERRLPVQDLTKILAGLSMDDVEKRLEC